jgi:hypothetical protein
MPTPLLPWAARSLTYGLGLPHARGGPEDYRTQYSNRTALFLFVISLSCYVFVLTTTFEESMAHQS